MPSKEFESLVKKVWARRPETPPSLAESREMMEQTGDLFPLPDGTDMHEVDAGGVPARWISMPGAAQDKVVLYLHGGGYVMGSIHSHQTMIAMISGASGARCLAINYRLAPEHKCPAAVEDVQAAYGWLLGQGIAAKNIAIAGDSAGGGLAVAALIAIRDAGQSLPGAAVAISPWVDMTGSGESVKTKADVDPMVNGDGLNAFAKMYVGDADLKHPLASPLFADLKGLPPMLVQVGTAEVLLDDSRRLAQRAKAAGVDVTLEEGEDMIHVWHWFAPMAPEGGEAIDRMGQYIKAHLG
jgi:acetyl esterase/lipase